MGEQVKMNPNKNEDIQNAIMNGGSQERKEKYEELRLHNSNLYELRLTNEDRINVYTVKDEIGMKEIGIKKICNMYYDKYYPIGCNRESEINIDDCVLHIENDFSYYRILLSDIKSGDIKISAFIGDFLKVYITHYMDFSININSTIFYYIK